MNKVMQKVLNIQKTKERHDPVGTRIFFTGRTQSGTVVTPDNAITIPAVWACLRYLSQSIAHLPWTVNRKTDRGVTEIVNNPVNWLLKKRVSDEYSSYQFRETLTHWALRWGNGYAEIERDTAGRPVALHPIHPSRVSLFRDNETYELFYEVAGNSGANVVFDPMDIFHVRGFGESALGVNVMAYAAESLGWAKAAQLFGAGFFGNGATPSGIITMKKRMSEDGLREVRREFGSIYTGPKNQAKVAFLDNEMSYQPLSIEPEKGQFLGTNQFLIDEVCRWFGVPPHKAYQLMNSTFSNIEHMSIEVVIDSLQPWAKRFEDEADFKLFPNNRTVFTQMDFRELLRGDTTTRLAYYRGLREVGAMNANEIRQAEGMNDIGPDGDKYVMQGQYTTIEKIGEDPEPEEPDVVEEPEEMDEPDVVDEPEETEEPENRIDELMAYVRVNAMIEGLENGKR